MSDLKALQAQIRNILIEQDTNKPDNGIQPKGGAQPEEDTANDEMPDLSEPDSGKEETGDPLFTVETMIKLVNAIRSGRSLKDKDVVQQLNDWWDKNKKVKLKSFLFMLAHITKIISEKPDEEGEIDIPAEEPSSDSGDEEANVPPIDSDETPDEEDMPKGIASV